MLQWLLSFNPSLTRNVLFAAVYKKLQSNKSKKPEALAAFLNAEFKSISSTDVIEPKNQPLIKVKEMEITDFKSKIAKHKSKPCQNCSELNVTVSVTTDLLKLEQGKASNLEKELEGIVTLKGENSQLHKVTKILKQKAWRTENKVQSVKSELQLLKQKRKLEVEEKEQKIEELEQKLQSKQRKIKDLSKDNKELQQSCDAVNEKLFQKQALQEVSLKSGINNAYSDNVRQAAILLQSEAGVSAKNVEKVLDIVGDHIFYHKFSEKLPSSQTCFNMNAEALVISNIQVAEKMLDSDKVTVHLDGTSRDHQKVVNHQITLDD